ncbi:GGDEF domain-containing protein [Azonexus sp. IMCC34839]|uniref:GGDEF domain-containing protein n=1 Tax=Azonexus sp. IMCC34839 TaxID=3133695 RepID=UPI00399A254C
MHSPTLLILLVILLGIMALSQIAACILSPRMRTALMYWAGANLFALLSSLNLLLRDTQPGSTEVLTAQASQFLIAYLMLMGTRCFAGLKPWPIRYGISLLLIHVGTATAFTLVLPSVAWRIIGSSLIIGTLLVLCARTIARGPIREYPARYFFAFACGLHALFVFTRIAVVSRSPELAVELTHSTTVPPLMVLEAIIFLVTTAISTLMLVNETVTTELRRLADIDHLTATFNRRSFLSLLNKAIGTAERTNTCLSVLVIDLDHFKEINDSHGHRIGDEALAHFAKTATACLRNEDILGRIGGEEFAVFLPNAAIADAHAIAERLRQHLLAEPLPIPHRSIPLTVSIGVAQYHAQESIESLLHRADKAMYRAKESGRNRVESSPLPLALPAVTE